MPIGQMFVINIHEDDTGTVIFDSVNITSFNHVAGFTTTTSVTKSDFTGTPNDAFVVKVAYPSTSLPAGSTTLTNMLQTAKDAVNNKYGNGEAGAPT